MTKTDSSPAGRPAQRSKLVRSVLVGLMLASYIVVSYGSLVAAEVFGVKGFIGCVLVFIVLTMSWRKFGLLTSLRDAGHPTEPCTHRRRRRRRDDGPINPRTGNPVSWGEGL
jgi:hypothetical protein